MSQGSLLCLWMLTQQLNLQLLSKEKLTLVDDITTKQAGIGSAQGTGPAALNR